MFEYFGIFALVYAVVFALFIIFALCSEEMDAVGPMTLVSCLITLRAWHTLDRLDPLTDEFYFGVVVTLAIGSIIYAVLELTEPK